MDNFYKLSERLDDVSRRFEIAQSVLEEAMEESGGEITEENAELLAEAEELEAIKRQLEEDFVNFPDEYAAWYKNEEAKRNVILAERKAYEDEMKKVLAKYDARIKKRESRMEWIKQNIEASMRHHNITKLDKKRPNAMFSMFFKKSQSIEVNEALALDTYREIERKANENCPEWLEFVPKIKKGVLSKVDDLPTGFERKTSETLLIQ